jgi:hypothetical protein
MGNLKLKGKDKKRINKCHKNFRRLAINARQDEKSNENSL